MTIKDNDLAHLHRYVELAAEAVDAGSQPFGSIVVWAASEMPFEDRNRTGGGDATRHPEFAIARWAAEHRSPRRLAIGNNLHLGRTLRDVRCDAWLGRNEPDIRIN